MRTIDIVLLGVLVILLVGMSGVLITAVSNENVKDNIVPNRQIVVNDINPNEKNFKEINLEKDQEDNGFETAVAGSALEKASAAALAHVGEGRVTDSEIGYEEGYYEIEITLDNGGELDVHLDENFNVQSTEYEDEGEDD